MPQVSVENLPLKFIVSLELKIRSHCGSEIILS